MMGTIAKGVIEDILCPECRARCIRFRSHWYCPHCLKRVIQAEGFWQAQFSKEFVAALRYRQQVSVCFRGQDHSWDLSGLEFEFDGRKLQLPIGHATCRLCGATMAAEFIYQSDLDEA